MVDQDRGEMWPSAEEDIDVVSLDALPANSGMVLYTDMSDAITLKNHVEIIPLFLDNNFRLNLKNLNH